MKKPNPKRIPKTQADVDKAHKQGMDFGVEFALNVILYVLKDKHNAPDADIAQLRDEFLYACDSVNKNRCSYADIRRTLKSDYDMTVEIV